MPDPDKKNAATSETIPPPIGPEEVVTSTDTKPSYLYLNDKPFGDAANYLVTMPPMNSSGDIYHILTYIIICLACQKMVPRILLTWDGSDTGQTLESKMNTYSQVQRALSFAEQLNYNSYFDEPRFIDTGKGQRENNREDKLRKALCASLNIVHTLDQKALTTMIACFFIEQGTEVATKKIRKGFQSRNNKMVPEKTEKKIWDEAKQAVESIKTKSTEKPVIVIQARYSSKANKTQNVNNSDFLESLQNYLVGKGFFIHFIFTDGRATRSFPTIVTNRIDPFPHWVEGQDYGKLYHLSVLMELLTLRNLKGIIGNTSGTLDLAGFLGHHILNFHNFAEKIDYQGFRIIVQSSFLSLEYLREEEVLNLLRDKDQKIGKMTDVIVTTQLPVLNEWIKDPTVRRVTPWWSARKKHLLSESSRDCEDLCTINRLGANEKEIKQELIPVASKVFATVRRAAL